MARTQPRPTSLRLRGKRPQVYCMYIYIYTVLVQPPIASPPPSLDRPGPESPPTDNHSALRRRHLHQLGPLESGRHSALRTFWLNFQGAHGSAAAAPSREHPALSRIRGRCHRGAEKCLVRSVGQRFGIDQDATQGCPPARPPPFPLQLPLATSHLAMSSRREASHGVSDEGGGRWAFRDRKRSPASTADVRTRTGRPGGMDERKREVWQQRATWHREDWAGMQHMAHSL